MKYHYRNLAFGTLLLKERCSYHCFDFPQITQINAENTKPAAWLDSKSAKISEISGQYNNRYLVPGALVYLIPLLYLFACVNHNDMPKSTDQSENNIIRYDDTRPGHWPEPFEMVEIPSTLDSNIQRAWFFPSSETTPQPLLISLHTWSGDYNQKDPLAVMAQNENWNYIHPDFRGPNWTEKACCSPFALEDIDLAIDYAIAHSHVDTSRIYVNGVSGGGYAALAVYMKSRHPINTISAWVPISDLEAWYEQSVIRDNKYDQNILNCTGSKEGPLNSDEARSRSPLFWKTPDRKTQLHIFDGVYDGVQGSVPITQSINFYNKLVRDMGAKSNHQMVTPEEIVYLFEHRKPMKPEGEIGGRKICLQKSFKNISLMIFEGNHEMLPDIAFQMFKND